MDDKEWVDVCVSLGMQFPESTVTLALYEGAQARTSESNLRAALLEVATANFPDGPCWCGPNVERHDTGCRKARAAFAVARRPLP